MKLLFITHGDRNKASSRVRAFWIGDELSELGEACDYVWPKTRLEILACLIDVFRNDVIIFQKTYGRWFHYLLLGARLLRKRVYMDIDDYPAPNNSQKTLKTYYAMLMKSHGVFTGCEALRKFVEPYQKNTYLVPSGIHLPSYPIGKTYPRPETDEICIGWSGNANTYAPDLIEILEEPLRQLAKRHQIRFKIIGACGVRDLYETFERIPGLRIDFSDSIDWDHSETVASHFQEFDIGLFPLLDNQYNQFKCGFKALEYMSFEIPVVASPVGVNADIITANEIGFLASNTSEWIESISTLIENTELRNQMGHAGRMKIESDFDVRILAKEMRTAIKTTTVL